MMHVFKKICWIIIYAPHYYLWDGMRIDKQSLKSSQQISQWKIA